ncbi:vanadium-dependent haloperoxidase [Hymenobacter sp. M29]|uniref:Vanadium-dependent haloperoxidase n=1 Tax=Hymenobacter mellowenesis TaxID=3063995 RepID=A0ABT9AGI5_9BACT|nr:vanadium-dependent haloperoxidase [Hymenobacter sp. M29]MDO7848477.1 vanadium-dependent haloperoxidase [Hymenobacter sp. M29]
MTPVIKHILLLMLGVGALAPACQPHHPTAYEPAADRIGWVVDGMNELMMHDVTNPPLAARFFAYSLLAGNEVLARHDPACPSLAGRLHVRFRPPAPASAGYSPRLAALLAVLRTAGKLQPSGKDLAAREQALVADCQRRGMPEELIAASQQYAQQMVQAVLAYAKQDGYYRISDRPRYTPSIGPGYWYPTPPAYLPAVEPYFGSLRPLMLDSAAQLVARPPQAFDPRPGSGFHQLMQQVRQTGDRLTEEQRQIAGFWDCNPFAVRDVGHLQVGLKKMSPGAHWMKIAGVACRQSKVPFGRALQIHTVLAMTLTDAFICCWREKYLSNRIRPETAIRHYLAPQWQPLLQTPPFPEYVSGHSVISMAAAALLGHYFGAVYSYTDNTEKEFGLRPRRFASFEQAAQEAAISRLYGGIHFLDAVQEGQALGQQVGREAIRRLAVPKTIATTF